MAIYHASTKPISRTAGRSSVAAAAYRAGAALVDERTGLVHDYTRKGGVVSADIITADGETLDRAALWNAAEVAEKRKDARTAREWIVALPSELDAGQRHELALSFGAELARRYGVAVDVCVHQPDREGDNRNHHAHILTTTRQVSRGERGEPVMGDKASIELSDKARRAQGLGPAADEVKAVRGLWEQTANSALAKAGRGERIDARSLAAQGIDREATTHLGPTASEMERRGRVSDRADGNRQVAANNAQRKALTAEIIDLKAERERREKVSQVEAMPAAELVKAWDARKKELIANATRRSQFLEHKLDGQIREISRERQQREWKHDEQRPKAPTGLFGRFQRKSYEKAEAAWQQVAKGIKEWRAKREKTLRDRLERVRGYFRGFGNEAKAERKLERERPDWAARLPAARAELKQQEQVRRKQRQAQRGLGNQGQGVGD